MKCKKASDSSTNITVSKVNEMPSNPKKFEVDTVFVSNLPTNALAKGIWTFFKKLDQASFDAVDIEELGLGFLTCVEANSKNIVIHRIAYIKCFGLPLNLWSTGTFSNLASKWGELLGVTSDIDNEFAFKLPVLKTATFVNEGLNGKFNFEGRLWEVCYREESS
ncbi:hypothetical protein AgCh_028380 [Apium graveolens]